MTNQVMSELPSLLDHFFIKSERHKNLWKHCQVPQEQLSGVYLFECDEGSRYQDFALSYVLDHLFLNSNHTCNVSIVPCKGGVGTAEDIYNIIQDYSMNGLINVDMTHISVVRNGLGVHNTNNSSNIFIDTVRNINEPVDIIVLGSEDMSWSLINEYIVKAATGVFRSVTFFNGGLVLEDKRNPLYTMKMQKNGRYTAVCALDFARDTAKQFIACHGLYDSIKTYPCTVKDILLTYS